MSPAVRAENALAEISKNLPDAALYQSTFTADAGHMWTYLGPGFHQIVGELPPTLPAPASWLTQRLNPADVAAFAAAQEQSRQQLTALDCDVRLRHASAGERWINVRGQPRVLADRSIVWDGIITDLTARREVEEAHRRQADFLAALSQATLELMGQRRVADVLPLLAARASLLLRAPSAEILLVENDELVSRAMSGAGPDETSLTTPDLAWQAIQTRAPVVLPRELEPARTQWVAVFPLAYDAHCLGALTLSRPEASRPFTEGEVRDGMLLAAAAARLVENARVHEGAAREGEARTAAARDRSLALMRATLESTADAILVVNSEGRIETYNLNFAEMWGIDLAHAGDNAKEEALLRTILDQLVMPERLLASVRDLYARSEEEVFDVLHCKDGRVLERYSRPQLLASHPAGRVWSFRDITEQRRSEAALRETEERFRVLAEVAPVGIFSSDTRGRTVFVNRRWCEIAGLTLEQALGDGWQAALHPEDRVEVADAWTQAVREGESSAAEFRFVKPDGTITSLVGQSRAQFHPNGMVAGYVGTITDVTALKRAEEERKQLEAESRQRRKMESLGTLAGGIAHDFNNILTGTFGFVDLARLELEAGHPAHAWLDRISSSSQRARDLVRQILTFSRKNETERMPQRLHTVIAEALRLLRSTLPPMIAIETHIAENAPAVLADSTQIHQVVLNLCTNAGHAMPEGGTIRVTLESCAVSSEQAAANADLKPGAWVRLTVADNGSGMDAGTLDHIFEPFFTTKGVGIGTGLGLAVVHGIVKSHEGAIAVRTTVGTGSAFELYFPAAPHDAELPKPPPTTVPLGAGGHILVVDDDNVCGFAVEKIIESLGYRATRCTHPNDALARFTATPNDFDLVISDLAMPGMDGAQLIEQLFKVRANIPVIVITGYIDMARQRQLEKTCTRTVLRKPVSRDELGRVLADYLPRTRPT